MSRLTKWINHHYTPKKDIRLGAYSECVQKLGRLEDLEEQGRLIELPCKLNTVLYLVSVSNDGKYKIDEVALFTYDQCLSLGRHIGNGFYLTKEEAEAKLAELKGSEE